MNKANMRAFMAWNTLTNTLINFSVTRMKKQKLLIASHGEEFEVTIKRLPKKFHGVEITGFFMDDSAELGQDNTEEVPGNERLETGGSGES